MFTAVVKRDGRWWIGWVEEIPGVNSQGHTRDELIENLRSALSEAIEMNRAAAVAQAAGEFEEVNINLCLRRNSLAGASGSYQPSATQT